MQDKIKNRADRNILFEEIIDSLPFKLYVVNKDMNVLLWNRKGEEGPFGVRKGDAVGKDLFSVLNYHRDKVVMPKDIGIMRDEFNEVFDKGVVVRKEEVSVATDGEKRFYRVTKFPLSMSGGSVDGAATCIEDVSRRRASLSFDEARDRAVSLGDMAGGIAHEINNPLAIMSVCVGSMQKEMAKNAVKEEMFSDKFGEYLGIMESEILRCKKIITDLLSFSRDRRFEKTELDINRVLSEALRLLTVQERYSRMGVETESKGALSNVYADEGQLKQVFTSIMLNAFESMEEDTGLLKISVSSAMEENLKKVRIRFEDNGVGMDSVTLLRIFDPFFKMKWGRGAGLGLAVAQSIIIDHGGDIGVKSEKGKGSVVTITLPAAG